MLILLETLAGYVVFKAMEANQLSQINQLFGAHGNVPSSAAPRFNLDRFDYLRDLNSVPLRPNKPKFSMAKGGARPVLQKIFVVDSLRKSKLDIEKPNLNIQKILVYVKKRVDLAYARRATASVGGAEARDNDINDILFDEDDADISIDVKGAIIILVQELLDTMDRILQGVVPKHREDYKSHFPELDDILQDDMQFVNVVNAMGKRNNILCVDLSTLIQKEIIRKIEEAALKSNGMEISDEKLRDIQLKCGDAASKLDFRKYLKDFLKAGMLAFAPNLTALIGLEAGVELIVRAGSLVNLANQPTSSYQFQGAHKPLRRVRKNTKSNQKKAVIYRAHVVKRSSKVNKGKMITTMAKLIVSAVRLDLQSDGKVIDFARSRKTKSKKSPSKKVVREINFDEDNESEVRVNGADGDYSNEDIPAEAIPLQNEIMDENFSGEPPQVDSDEEEIKLEFPIMVHIEIEPEHEPQYDESSDPNPDPDPDTDSESDCESDSNSESDTDSDSDSDQESEDYVYDMEEVLEKEKKLQVDLDSDDELEDFDKEDEELAMHSN